MRFEDFAHTREARLGAAGAPRTCRVDAMEAVEDARLVLYRDAGPVSHTRRTASPPAPGTPGKTPEVRDLPF